VNVKEFLHTDEHAGFIALVSTFILWRFVLYYVIKPYFFKNK